MIGVVAALPAEARCLAPSAGRRIVVSGVGAAAAARACATLLAEGAAGLVSWGTAAGLTETVPSGQVVIAGSEAWVSGVMRRLAGIAVRGGIACPSGILRTASEKRALALATGAVIADMETDAVRQVADAAGVPWLAVRAVADAVDVGVPVSVLQAIDGQGRVSYGRLGAALLGRPRDVAALPGVARGFSAALRSLRAVGELSLFETFAESA
jgi:adenosylhomocysteine nucleosidase